MRTLLCCIALISAFGSVVEARLAPRQAERVLASLGQQPPMPEEDWLDLLGDRRRETYQVSEGDTLWGISGRLFGNAFLWGKLWATNPFITNPHLIEPGQTLAFFREWVPRGIATSEQSKVVRLVPTSIGQARDLDRATYVNVQIKSKYRPQLMVLTEKDKIHGEIRGAYTAKSWFTEFEDIFIELDDPELAQPGRRFGIVKEVRDIRSGSAATRLGTIVRWAGELEVVQAGEDLVRARVLSSNGPIAREDLLINTIEPLKWDEVLDPPEEVEINIVAGEVPRISIFRQGDLVLMDKGTEAGVQSGQLYRALRDTDPATESESDVIVDFKGEVQIIYANEVSSVGFVWRSESPLALGDTLLPHQKFADREQFIPSRENAVIEIP